MKKINALRRMLSLLLAAVIIISLPLSVFAEETNGTVDVETTAGNTEAVDVVISIETETTPDGETNVHSSTVADGAVTDSGLVVDYRSNSDMTTNTDNVTTGTAESTYTVTDNSGTYTAAGGSELTLETSDFQATVDVPLEEGQTQTAVGEAAGTADDQTAPEGGIYDYTTETVVTQGEVSVTTSEVTVEILDAEQTEHEYKSDLEYVRSDVAPSATNDLVTEVYSAAPEDHLPGTDAQDPEIPAGGDGYDYVYAGTGNTSQLRPAIVFTEPLTEEEILAFHNAYIPLAHIKYFPTDLAVKDENGAYVTDSDGYLLDKDGNRIRKEELSVVSPDGTTLYLHRIDLLGKNHYVEGWYQDGQWVEELNGDSKYGVVYASSQQFVLVDKATGETITTYCADIATQTQDGFGYTMENLEDADYYSEEQAAQIRAIALNGYWGTLGTETDEAGNEVPKTGSLEAMKAMLRTAVDENGQRIFTDEELDNSLTDGVALTATQMAIWSCSNKMDGVQFVNSHYVDTPDKTETTVTGTGSNIPADKEDETVLMFKIYEYLTHLEPVEVKDTSAETVMTAENFVQDLSVTVVEKAENHENNADADASNDAYVTELSFTLVVVPSTENGDDMIVKIISGDGQVREYRLAGENKEGQNLETLECDENGNYTVKDLVLTEGNQQFNITLEGIQNLSKGVYLYTSEIRDLDGDPTSSQTMVGLAEGAHAVNVSMTINFELDVKDEVVATEHVWRTEQTHHPVALLNDPVVPHAPNPVAEENGEIIIEDEPVPLADVPETGDPSTVFAALSAFSALGLAGLSLTKKRKED